MLSLACEWVNGGLNQSERSLAEGAEAAKWIRSLLRILKTCEIRG